MVERGPDRVPYWVLPSKFVSPFTPGELIMHTTHGLSRYIGVRLFQAEDGSTAEYFQLDYANGDRVFVPIGQVARLSKYVGNQVDLARLTAGIEHKTPYSRGQKPAPQ
jgi:transcription-repair coupling factor (superfamily II helicase)